MDTAAQPGMPVTRVRPLGIRDSGCRRGQRPLGRTARRRTARGRRRRTRPRAPRTVSRRRGRSPRGCRTARTGPGWRAWLPVVTRGPGVTTSRSVTSSARCRYRPPHDGDVRAPAEGQRQPGVRRVVVRADGSRARRARRAAAGRRWCATSGGASSGAWTTWSWTAADHRLGPLGAGRRVQPVLAARPLRARGRRSCGPLPLAPLRRQDDDVVTIQRYAGKTNEALTHLLVNVALAAGRRRLRPAPGRRGGPAPRPGLRAGDHPQPGDRLRDGRGRDRRAAPRPRGLRGLRAGLAAGQAPEAQGQPGQAAQGPGRSPPTAARSPTDPAGTAAAHRCIDIVHDDAAAARTHLPARSIDVLACDLPVRRAARGHGHRGRCQRSPHELLETALPVWFDLLRPGAGVGLAWNRHTLPRDRLVHLLATHGFELVVPAVDERFVHRVDRSITRDVARGPPARCPGRHHPPRGATL